jgi:hypothetical protein
MRKIAGSGSESIIQRHGSVDPDPGSTSIYHGSATLVKTSFGIVL